METQPLTDAQPAMRPSRGPKCSGVSPDAATKGPKPDASPWGGWIYYAIGLGLVGLFYGEFLFSDRVGILDWSKDLYYFSFLYDALRSFGGLPVSFLVIPPELDWFSTLQDASFWSNPEVLSLSPFLPLAFFLPFMVFVKAYFAAQLAVAVWGIRLLSRRLGWDLGQSVLLLVFFLGNPWLVQHLAIGYSPQISLCLLPLCLALLAGPDWRPLEGAAASLVLAVVFYQGALHLFVWSCLAIGVYVLVQAALRRRAAALWRAGTFFLGVLILIAPKVYAVSKVYAGWHRIPGYGYQTLAHLWGLLTDDTFFMFQFPQTYSQYNVAFYDGSILVGPAFLLLAAWLVAEYGVALLRQGMPLVRRTAPALAALVAAAVFLVLGWSNLWQKLCVLFPALSSEIYPFRFLFVTLNFLFFFIVCRLGRFPAKGPARLRAAAVYALALATCLTFYGRNRMLMPYLTKNPNLIGDFSIAHYYGDRVIALSGETRLPTTPTPNGITIIPSGIPGQRIDLPWLPRTALGGYTLRHARPAAGPAGDTAVIEVTAASVPVMVMPKDYHRAALLAAAAIVFAGLQGAMVALARKRPGLFAAKP